MDTSNGYTLRPGGGGDYCQHWHKDVSGTEDHSLSYGDLLSVSLCDDRSMSITYNNTEVPQVLTDLPDKPLWVVIEMWVGKLEVICP